MLRFLIRLIKNYLFKRELSAYQRGLAEMQQPIYANGYLYGFWAAKHGFPLERSKMAGYTNFLGIPEGLKTLVLTTPWFRADELPDPDKIIKDWEEQIRGVK